MIEAVLENPKLLKAALKGAKPDRINSTLLFGIVRSFVRLAELKNVDIAAQEIGISRQSVTSQIRSLEQHLGEALFEKISTTSNLTVFGERWFPRAKKFLRNGNEFLDHSDGQSRNVKTADDYGYSAKLIPVRDIPTSAPPLIAQAAALWKSPVRPITDSAFNAVRDKWVLYRKIAGRWHSKDIGKDSAFANFFGADAAIVSSGLSVTDMTSGLQLKDEMSFALDGVAERGGMQLFKVSCRLPEMLGGPLIDKRYQRLLMESYIPGGEVVVVSIIVDNC